MSTRYVYNTYNLIKYAAVSQGGSTIGGSYEGTLYTATEPDASTGKKTRGTAESVRLGVAVNPSTGWYDYQDSATIGPGDTFYRYNHVEGTPPQVYRATYQISEVNRKGTIISGYHYTGTPKGADGVYGERYYEYVGYDDIDPTAITYENIIAGQQNVVTLTKSSGIKYGGNIGYLIQISTDGGSTWNAAANTKDLAAYVDVPADATSFMARACAYCGTFTSNTYVTGANVSAAPANNAPGAPGAITLPETILGGKQFTVSWGAASDEDGNLEGYILQRSTDGGTVWEEIQRSDQLSKTGSLTLDKYTRVAYRVRAYDTEGATSDWVYSTTSTVVNNHVPTAPTTVKAAPTTASDGDTIVITWSGASDTDNNLSAYVVEKSAQGGDWEQIYQGTETSCTDTADSTDGTLQYRVKAGDVYGESSEFTTSNTVTVDSRVRPVITIPELGTKNGAFTVSCTVSHESISSYNRVKAEIDGVEVGASLGTASGTEKGITVTVTELDALKLGNRAHKLSVTVWDSTAGQLSGSAEKEFSKAKTGGIIKLKNPVVTDKMARFGIINILGDTENLEYSVKATNNAKESSPVWVDCTALVKAGRTFEMSNTSGSPAFAFEITVTGGEGYIASVSGALQEVS